MRWLHVSTTPGSICVLHDLKFESMSHTISCLNPREGGAILRARATTSQDVIRVSADLHLREEVTVHSTSGYSRL